jgi:hypothetical protein
VYEPESGMIKNKSRNRLIKGSDKGTRCYLRTTFTSNGKNYVEDIHRVDWALCKGCWPVGTIDHINGNPLDNHIENLRECSMGENQMNIELPWEPNSKTGVPGVDKHGRKYRTYIRGRHSSFSSPYEAFFHATMCGKRYRQRQETTLGIFSTMNHKNL